jgi:tetratricopeptide (TPR) repeat protein
MKKKILIFINLLIGLNSFAKGDLEKANQLYQKGDYDNAAKSYENIVKQGLEAPELYYNLGNSYFKLNNIPSSILNYERALKLAPGDKDIDFNLKMANLRVVDKIAPIPVIFYRQWITNIRDMYSADTWGIITIVIFLITIILFILFILSRMPEMKRLFFYLGILFLILTGGSWYFGSKQQAELTAVNKAIIFEPSAYVKSSPNEKSVDLFILHEGTKVEILDEIGEWKRIKLANGNEGWLPAGSIQVI